MKHTKTNKFRMSIPVNGKLEFVTLIGCSMAEAIRFKQEHGGGVIQVITQPVRSAEFKRI